MKTVVSRAFDYPGVFPLHPAHPAVESALVLAIGLLIVATALALTREGWVRVGALSGTALVGGCLRVGVEAIGIGAHPTVHLTGHGLEVGAVFAAGLAGYYALFDIRAPTTTEA